MGKGKGNTQAARSAQAAQLLEGNLGGTSQSLLAAANGGFGNLFAAASQESTNEPIDLLEPSIRVTFKKLIKKDAQTREKALRELVSIVSDLPPESKLAAFNYFSSVVTKLMLDGSATVRQWSLKLITLFVSQLKKQCERQLKELLPIVRFSTFDQLTAVNNAATAFFQSFGADKVAQVQAVSTEPAAAFCAEILTGQSALLPAQTYDEEEQEAERVGRLRSQALRCANSVVVDRSSSSARSRLSQVFSDSKSLKTMLGWPPELRSSVLLLGVQLAENAPDLGGLPTLEEAVLKDLRKPLEPHSVRLLDALISVSAHPGFWQRNDGATKVLPTIEGILRAKSSPFFSSIPSRYLPLLGRLLESGAFADQFDLCGKLLSAMCTGIGSGENERRPDFAWFSATIECVRLSLSRGIAPNLLDQLVSVVRLGLGALDEKTLTALADLLQWLQGKLTTADDVLQRLVNLDASDATLLKLRSALIPASTNPEEILEGLWTKTLPPAQKAALVAVLPTQSRIRFLEKRPTLLDDVFKGSQPSEVLNALVALKPLLADSSLRLSPITSPEILNDVDFLGRLALTCDDAGLKDEERDRLIPSGQLNCAIPNAIKLAIAENRTTNLRRLLSRRDANLSVDVIATLLPKDLDSVATSVWLELSRHVDDAVILEKAVQSILKSPIGELGDTLVDVLDLSPVFQDTFVHAVDRSFRSDPFDSHVLVDIFCTVLNRVADSQSALLAIFNSTRLDELDQAFAIDLMLDQSLDGSGTDDAILRTKLIRELERRAQWWQSCRTSFSGSDDSVSTTWRIASVLALALRKVADLHDGGDSEASWEFVKDALFAVASRKDPAHLCVLSALERVKNHEKRTGAWSVGDSVTLRTLRSKRSNSGKDGKCFGPLYELRASTSTASASQASFLLSHFVSDNSAEDTDAENTWTLESDDPVLTERRLVLMDLACKAILAEETADSQPSSEALDYVRCGLLSLLTNVDETKWKERRDGKVDVRSDAILARGFHLLQLLNDRSTDSEWADFFRPAFARVVYTSLAAGHIKGSDTSILARRLITVYHSFLSNVSELKDWPEHDAQIFFDPRLDQIRYPPAAQTLLHQVDELVRSKETTTHLFAVLVRLVERVAPLLFEHENPGDWKEPEAKQDDTEEETVRRVATLGLLVEDWLVNQGDNDNDDKRNPLTSVVGIAAAASILASLRGTETAVKRMAACDRLGQLLSTGPFRRLFEVLPDQLPANTTGRDWTEWPQEFARLDDNDDDGEDHLQQRLAFRALYSLCREAPAVVRLCYVNLPKSVASSVSRWIQTHIRPLVVADELSASAVARLNSENLSVRVASAVGELWASYRTDETTMQLTIALPADYPLSPPDIQISKAIVPSAGVRRWQLQLTTFLYQNNGSVADGVDHWRQRVESTVAAADECAVCMSTVHAKTSQLPKQRCPTCRHKFHSACLYKWFESSNKTTCPLCRSNFN